MAPDYTTSLGKPPPPHRKWEVSKANPEIVYFLSRVEALRSLAFGQTELNTSKFFCLMKVFFRPKRCNLLQLNKLIAKRTITTHFLNFFSTFSAIF